MPESVPESEACNFIKKETLAQVFSCEFCEISKNSFSYRTPPVAASVLLSLSEPYFGPRQKSMGKIFLQKKLTAFSF